MYQLLICRGGLDLARTYVPSVQISYEYEHIGKLKHFNLLARLHAPGMLGPSQE